MKIKSKQIDERMAKLEGLEKRELEANNILKNAENNRKILDREKEENRKKSDELIRRELEINERALHIQKMALQQKKKQIRYN